MRLLVAQHSAGEPPAAFGAHALAAGDTLHVVRLFAGEPIPNFAGYDALLVMGGPMDVWEEDNHPWLIPEKAAIRAWVQTGKPYLGICLGRDVTLKNASDDPLLSELPAAFKAMHWHGVEVVALPASAHILGSSTGCKNQIMRVGERAWGLQFHPELERGTITQWMEDPANVVCASNWLGSEAAAWEFARAAEAEADQFLDRSRRLYTNFRALS